MNLRQSLAHQRACNEFQRQVVGPCILALAITLWLTTLALGIILR